MIVEVGTYYTDPGVYALDAQDGIVPVYLSSLAITNGSSVLPSSIRISGTSTLITATSTLSTNNYIATYIATNSIGVPAYNYRTLNIQKIMIPTYNFNISTYPYLYIPNNYSIIGTSNFTIESWIYLNSYGANAALILDIRIFPWVDTTNNNTAFFFTSTSGYLGFYLIGTGFYYSNNNPIQLNKWTHVAWQRKGTSMELYVNGTCINTANIGNNFSSSLLNLTQFFIGGAVNYPNTNISNFNGSLNQLSVSTVLRYSSTTPSTPLKQLLIDSSTIFFLGDNYTDSVSNISLVNSKLPVLNYLKNNFTNNIIFPLITLTSTSSVNIEPGSIYTEPGVSSVDYLGTTISSIYIISLVSSSSTTNLLSSNILISGSTTTITLTNTLPKAIYTITYQATDTNGNIGYNTRILKIMDAITLLNTDSALQIYYRFNVGDSSGTNLYNYATGSPVANAVLVNGASISTNNYKVGGASLLLNAANNQYVQITNLVIANTPGYSFCMWLYPDNVSSWAQIFTAGTRATTCFGLSIPNSTSLYHAIVTNTSTYTDNMMTLSYNYNQKWIHVAWTLTNSGIWTVYINGTLFGTYSSKLYLNARTYTPSAIGTTLIDVGQSLFNGYIDDFRIYNRALTASEIITLYNSAVPSLTLIGNSSILVKPGSVYTDPGITSVDSLGNPIDVYITSFVSNSNSTNLISSNILISGTTTTIPLSSTLANGTYIITYNATNANGIGMITRTINITKIVTYDFNKTTYPYLYIPNNYSILGTSNFTIESWVYLNSYDGYASYVFDLRGYPSYSETNSGSFSIHPNGNLRFYINSWPSSEYWSNSSTIVQLKKWTHIAWQRNANNIELYINGICVANVYVSNISLSFSGGFFIGGAVNLANKTGAHFNGSLNQLTVSSTLRYSSTATFTPSKILKSDSSTIFFLGDNFTDTISGISLSNSINPTLGYLADGVNNNIVAPIMSIVGNTSVNLTAGTSFVDPGITAVDYNNTALSVYMTSLILLSDNSNLLTGNILISGSTTFTQTNSLTGGTLKATYTATDQLGNIGYMTRNIIINPSNAIVYQPSNIIWAYQTVAVPTPFTYDSNNNMTTSKSTSWYFLSSALATINFSYLQNWTFVLKIIQPLNRQITIGWDFKPLAGTYNNGASASTEWLDSGTNGRWCQIYGNHNLLVSDGTFTVVSYDQTALSAAQVAGYYAEISYVNGKVGLVVKDLSLNVVLSVNSTYTYTNKVMPFYVYTNTTYAIFYKYALFSQSATPPVYNF